MQIVLVKTVTDTIQNKHAKISKCKNQIISTIRLGRNVISTELSMEFILLMNSKMPKKERSGSVVECMTRDRGAACSSLTGVTALCP